MLWIKKTNKYNLKESNMYKLQIKNARLSYSETPYYICMQQLQSYIDHTEPYIEIFVHQGFDYWNSIVVLQDTLPVWLRIVIFVFLTCLSGLFSGLNLGLMQLNVSELEILMKIGTSIEKEYARTIYPLRKHGTFLLCSILISVTFLNAVNTLTLGDMLSGLYAAIGSTILIVTFCEIVPQAICSRFGLMIGAKTIHLMYLFMFITSPLSYPVSRFLDLVLGQELATVYGRDKIRELLKNVEDLDDKEFKFINGALDFNKKKYIF